ncbi:MAG: hypothetical protein ACJAZN_003006, partial [Planctomycetota bacterium]
ETKLFRYPLSYAIDSIAAKSLPEPLSERVWQRLTDLFCRPLRPDDLAKYGAYIDAEGQTAVREILEASGADRLGD